MKEKYLHYLWKYKLLPFHKMKLYNGDSFKIIYNGDYNAYESGPDFYNAKIEINGIVWIGNVELHVRSKDWFLHNHQNDKTYDTVILHVVYEFNGEVVQNNNLIPTLELKSVIDLNHYQKYLTLFTNKNTILCGSLLKHVSLFNIVAQQESALFKRLYRKTSDLNATSGSNDPKQILYLLLARAMGSKINQLPFEEITQRLPLHTLKKIIKKDQNKLLKLTSGIHQMKSISDCVDYQQMFQRNEKILNGMVNINSWKYCGTRPKNAPTIRIHQFAEIVENFDFNIAFIYLTIYEFYKYCIELLTIFNKDKVSKLNNYELSLNFKHQIIINCFVPFLFWYGQVNEKDDLVDKAMDLLRILPPENNSVILKWKSFGLKAKNAAETQAMLEIYNEFCTNKKCLSCSFGIQLLSK